MIRLLTACRTVAKRVLSRIFEYTYLYAVEDMSKQFSKFSEHGLLGQFASRGRYFHSLLDLFKADRMTGRWLWSKLAKTALLQEESALASLSILIVWYNSFTYCQQVNFATFRSRNIF